MMRALLYIVGAVWTAIGGWYLFQSLQREGAQSDAFGYSLLFGMLLYVIPGLILLALGSMLGRRAERERVSERARTTRTTTVVSGPTHVAPAAAASTGAAALASRDGVRTHADAHDRSATARLEELDELRARKAVTQTEYEQRRSEILRGL